jgi:RHS repeat-associated protein
MYDSNGNLTGDGSRAFEYDCENQLTTVYVAAKWRSEFRYDGKMRRRVRREYAWSSGNWQLTNEVRYVYDGNLVIQERHYTPQPTILGIQQVVAYTRGRDLSGSFEGAGGIGGLLARSALSSFNSQPSTAFYHCDGNGNITCLINASNAVVAKYLYDPYGSILARSGPLAEANVYRFSSKELHMNSGLVYYLYRYYEPSLQRWLGRDPVQEWGGACLYAFLGNRPLSLVDTDGLDWWPPSTWPFWPFNRQPRPPTPPQQPPTNIFWSPGNIYFTPRPPPPYPCPSNFGYPNGLDHGVHDFWPILIPIPGPTPGTNPPPFKLPLPLPVPQLANPPSFQDNDGP